MGYVSPVEAPRDERTSLQAPSQPRTVLCWQDPLVPGPPSPTRVVPLLVRLGRHSRHDEGRMILPEASSYERVELLFCLRPRLRRTNHLSGSCAL